ncbi:MAG: cytochrome o ubiquinol oxidase subunit I, partial [Methyloceanibacter sp.]|nr:cytochrome o ubiquinol oxidase subunit I [Methyloceanibacter sp.]
SLEWATSSPAAPYNFAVIPDVKGLDAFWQMKAEGIAYKQPAHYEDITLPKNSGLGLMIGVLGGVFGFAMIWWIWWLALLSLALIGVLIIIRACDDHTNFVMPASEVKTIEDAWFAKIAKAPRNEMENDPGFAGEPVPEGSA